MEMYIITKGSIEKVHNDFELSKLIKYYVNNNIKYILKFTDNIDKLLKIKKELSSLAA